ncbi:MAG: hypothetical protein H8E92_06675, partial [SAR86 cluster bacterium]|nr:hypothetical protein [SAR86 cluster bacterium]
MSTYPFAIDDDSTIIRIDDNISEMGGEASNQLRDAVFAIQSELGINPAGSAGTLATRLNVSINPNGTLKTSALTSVGLVTLPIDDAQVGSGAGIKEFKLDLDHSTSDLHTLILANSALINSLTTFTSTTASDLATHIAGGALLTSGAPARHVASHIDLNVVPLDPRDPAFVWSGLLDKDGALRPGTTVASALFEINTDFVNHQNAIADAHEASAVNIDVDDFQEIPQTVNTVQKLADHLDDFEVITVTEHRATQHANAIPKVARSQSCTLSDGYKENVVPPTPCSTFLVRAPNTMPVDDISAGDDIVSFVPDNAGFVFDSQFSQVRVGDVIRINYANGVEASFPIDSIRYVPGTEWIVRLNGVNLADSDGYALARIDRPLFDRDTAGILAVAAANATPTGSFDTILSSLVVGHPRGAMALGLGFDPGQLDASHFNLHLELYPTGNPNDRVISMPAVDVTGNLGTTPGQYTLENVVQSINNRFREIGFNFRFIAFAHDGNLGIMLADAINCASFAVVKGVNSSGTLATGTFTNNVIGESAGDTFDAFGFGADHIDIAGPTFISSFTDATAAQLPTKVIVPLKRRNYIVNGRKRDDFADTCQANEDGYWDGYISARTTIGAFTVETTYPVILAL